MITFVVCVVKGMDRLHAILWSHLALMIRRPYCHWASDTRKDMIWIECNTFTSITNLIRRWNFSEENSGKSFHTEIFTRMSYQSDLASFSSCDTLQIKTNTIVYHLVTPVHCWFLAYLSFSWTQRLIFNFSNEMRENVCFEAVLVQNKNL